MDYYFSKSKNYDKKRREKGHKNFAAARIEPGTSCVRDGREDHYTTVATIKVDVNRTFL